LHGTPGVNMAAEALKLTSIAKPNKAWELRIHVIIVLSLTVFDG
jgi:hypothetical protein